MTGFRKLTWLIPLFKCVRKKKKSIFSDHKITFTLRNLPKSFVTILYRSLTILQVYQSAFVSQLSLLTVLTQVEFSIKSNNSEIANKVLDQG